MTKSRHPYVSQPPKAFWRQAIENRAYSEIRDIWNPLPLKRSDFIATAGSCFAQHIGFNLAKRGARWLDMEPAPPIFDTRDDARRWGYGIFSCRFGNIYTSRQLLQLFHEAHGMRKPVELVWERNGRFFDALRPGVDPVGQDSPDIVSKLREVHLSAVQRMFNTLDVFVFTLGLTEGWRATIDGTMYPLAPGTIAGTYNSEKYVFHNLRYNEIRSDLEEFRAQLLKVNSNARILLTVSPVPLAATASGQHVLVASTYSKSVLRAIAGEMSDEFANVYYFPSFEIINSHPSRGMFFDPDLRNVSKFGVDFVMKNFFSDDLEFEFPEKTNEASDQIPKIMCDEDLINRL